MEYKAIVSAHIWLDDNDRKDIEILSQIDNDEKGTEIFSDIDHALRDEIDIGDSKDYYFIAIVKSEFVEHQTFEGTDYDVEHEVTEIKLIEDIKAVE
jgi:hypothetical protein